jgi:hypothetical protein
MRDRTRGELLPKGRFYRVWPVRDLQRVVADKDAQ